MRGDERCACRAGGGEGSLEAVVHPYERAETDRDRVRREQRVAIVVGQLKPRDEEQAVGRPGAVGLAFDRAEVVGERRSAGHLPARVAVGRVVPADMVGHAENVETVLPVEIDELGERQLAVAPRRVGVELAEERRGRRAHPVSPSETVEALLAPVR
jgi:hypothetical protein